MSSYSAACLDSFRPPSSFSSPYSFKSSSSSSLPMYHVCIPRPTRMAAMDTRLYSRLLRSMLDRESLDDLAPVRSPRGSSPGAKSKLGRETQQQIKMLRTRTTRVLAMPAKKQVVILPMAISRESCRIALGTGSPLHPKTKRRCGPFSMKPESSPAHVDMVRFSGSSI